MRKVPLHASSCAITRDFEPKEAPDGQGVLKFKQCRWYDFYQFLKNSEPSPTGVTRELVSFMEEHNMSQSNQFSPLDVLALSNFQKARKIMDATMWEGVSLKFERVAGGVSSQKRASSQLRDKDRYVMYVVHGKG